MSANLSLKTHFERIFTEINWNCFSSIIILVYKYCNGLFFFNRCCLITATMCAYKLNNAPKHIMKICLHTPLHQNVNLSVHNCSEKILYLFKFIWFSARRKWVNVLCCHGNISTSKVIRSRSYGQISLKTSNAF